MIDSRVLRGLVAISVVYALAACSGAPVAPVAQTGTPARQVPPPAAATAAPGPVSVRLAALESSRREPTDVTRNPFLFQPKFVPPPPRPIVPPTRVPEARPGPVAPTGPPPPPPIPLKFLGVVTRANGVRWAVLSDGKLPIYGRETDIIDGQYRIVSIGTDSIELSYADGRGRQTVKLSGQ